jgi:hypothetical protein
MFRSVIAQGVIGAALLSLCVLALPSDAHALSKDLYRARALDACIYDQYDKAKDHKGAMKACRCAAKAYVNGLGKAELDKALKSGKIGWSEKRAIAGAYAKCK